MNGCCKLSRREFYALGGFSNPNLFRKNGPNYTYWRIVR